MKNPNQSMIDLIGDILSFVGLVILALILTLIISSCNLVDAVPPIDFPALNEDPPPPPQGLCIEDTLYTEPQFITGSAILDAPLDTPVWHYKNMESTDLSGLLAVALPAWMEFEEYNSGKHHAVIAKGTNSYQHLNQPANRIWTRDANGVKTNMTFFAQQFAFLSALTYEEYKQVADEYKSVNRFNFKQTNYDSIEYINLAWTILGQCKEGREKADFRGLPFIMPDTVINAFILAGWDEVNQ